MTGIPIDSDTVDVPEPSSSSDTSPIERPLSRNNASAGAVWSKMGIGRGARGEINRGRRRSLVVLGVHN